MPTLANQEHHLNSNAPGPPGKLLGAGGKESATLMMRQKLHLVLSGIDGPLHHMLVAGGNVSGVGPAGAGSGSAVDVNHAYNSVNNATVGSLSSLGSLRWVPTQFSIIGIPVNNNDFHLIVHRDSSQLNSPLCMPHAHHSLSPSLSYTKSPIPTIVSHTNNVNASNAYTCNAPFGLKTVDGLAVGVGVVSSSPATNAIGNSNAITGSNSSSSCNVPGLGTVSGISVITSMGSNSLCGSAAPLGEGPPTPTQELDLSGSALEQHQHQHQQVAAAAAAAAAAMAAVQATQQAAQQAQQQRKRKHPVQL